MVSEDTAAVTEDTAASEAVEQPADTLPETSTPDVAPETDTVDATPETEQTPDYSRLSEDDLIRLNKERGIEARIRESARREIEQQQRLEAGRSEVVEREVTALLDSAREALERGEDVPRNIRERIGLAWQRAQATGTVGALTAYAEQLEANDEIDVSTRATAVRLLKENDTVGYFDTLNQGLVAARLKQSRLKDVPEGSPLHKDVDAEVERRLAAEMKARGIEAKPKRDPAPPVPVGTPGRGALNIQTMTDADRAYNESRITFDQYKAYRKQFGVAAVPR